MWKRDNNIGGWTLACFRLWTGKIATCLGEMVRDRQRQRQRQQTVEGDYPVILYAIRLWKSIVEMCVQSPSQSGESYRQARWPQSEYGHTKTIAKTLDFYKQGSNRVRRTIIPLRQEELAVSQGTCCETLMMIAVAYCDGTYGYCKD